MLGERVGAAVDWLTGDVGREWKIGLFGASTGAAAALLGSINRPSVKVCKQRLSNFQDIF